MLTLPARGRCQCGHVRYTVSSQPFVAYTCHCSECQHLTGSAFLTCMQVAAEGVTVTAGEPVGHARRADSGNVLTTWRCPCCGSTLYAENSARPRVRTVHVGSLEDPDAVDVSAHIWLARKLPWLTVPASHRTFDGPGDWTEDYAADPTRYRNDPG